MKILSVCVGLLVLLGCTNKTVYEGMQARNRNQCYTLPPPQVDECLERESKSFEEYERDRQEVVGE